MTSLGEKGRQIAIKASSIDSGASEEVFSHGAYGPFCMDIPGMFARYDSLPDWEALRTLAAGLNPQLQELVYSTVLDSYTHDGDETLKGKPEFEAIGTIAGEMNNWIGDAADSFINAVEVPAKNLIPNQYWALRSLQVALEAEASLWETVHSNLDGIADSALSALEHVEEKGPLGFDFAIGVLGSITAITGALAAPATGGASLALTLTVYGAAKSTFDGAKELGDGWSTSGDSPVEIIDELRKAAIKIEQDAATAEGKIASGLQSIVANTSDPVFHFRRPSLVRHRNFTGHA